MTVSSSLFARLCALSSPVAKRGLASVGGLLLVATAAMGCTEKETPDLPPPGMAGAPSSLGQHGSVAPAPTQPPSHQQLPGAASAPHGQVAGAASQPATPNFPTIVPGSGAPPPQGAVAEPTHAGVVTESMDAADYTYMKIKKDDGKEEWAATTRTAVKVGDRVVISESLVMHDFQSKSLGRTFPRIIFGTRK